MKRLLSWWHHLTTKKKILVGLVLTSTTLISLIGLMFAYVMIVVYPKLPDLENIRDYRPKLAMRVYSQEGALMGEFGEERRTFVAIDDMPELMKNAVIAIEDERFYQHSGVDFFGIMRAALANVFGHRQGASTITQQVARNFYLTNEQTLTRKFYEALMAIKIENELTKDQILELYMNQIFLGQRAYGFAAAAQNYFSKNIHDLNLSEMAMLAGLPKAPSTYNPVVNPKRAKIRQQYILQRMLELGYIDKKQYDQAKEDPIRVKKNHASFDVKADYVAEMARQQAIELYGESAYSRGISVYTTIRADEQNAAYQALRRNLIQYEKRQAYRGPEQYLDLSSDEQTKVIEDAFLKYPDIDDVKTAVVLEATPKDIKAEIQSGEVIQITGKNLDFVKSALKKDAKNGVKIVRGAVIRVIQTLDPNKTEYEVIQVPKVESAFVALNTNDGAIRALVGGFDFNSNKFNRVTQAWRQPGSSIKPFIYAAAFERGLMPTTLVNDSPISIESDETGGQLWEPKNYGDDYDGPIPVKTALAKSKNMVSIRIIREITPSFAKEYLTRFGFDADKVPAYLTLALGATSITPLQDAAAYAVFANGGFLVTPYVVDRIEDQNGKVLYKNHPKQAGDEEIRAIDERNAFVTDSVLQGVVKRGTAAKANSLNYPGLAGKTGTTNESKDVWFAGYHPAVAAVAWVGYDNPKSLGDRETGGGLALPIWIDYMKVTLPKLPDATRTIPENVTKIGDDYYYSEFIPGLGIRGIDVGDAAYVDSTPTQNSSNSPANASAAAASGSTNQAASSSRSTLITGKPKAPTVINTPSSTNAASQAAPKKP
jgi:penicillin-binding protein 1A